MVKIERYGPVLDVVIQTLEELSTRNGQAEVYVPTDRDAAGMAADLHSVLFGLYPFLDSQIYFRGRAPTLVEGKDKPRVRRFNIRYMFVQEPFEMPTIESFFSYPGITIINLEQEAPFEHKPEISVRAVDTPKRSLRSPFIEKLRANMALPPERCEIAINLSYQSISPFPLRVPFQHFRPSGRFTRELAHREGWYYPVSAEQRHEVKRGVWNLLQSPTYWHSQAQYSSIAINKMAGVRTYEESATLYRATPELIFGHAEKIEPVIVDIIRAYKEKRGLIKIMERLGCPPEREDIYLKKTMKTLRSFCNPSALSAPEKRAYLGNLSMACKDYGFQITPQELAFL